MKKSHEKQICFPTINFSVMEIILEYIYMESFKDYFQLLDLRDFVILTLKKAKYAENHLPELLSKIVDTMPLSAFKYIDRSSSNSSVKYD